MKNREPHSTRPVRRINLSLPIVRANSHEIYYPTSPAQTRQPSTVRPVSRQKSILDTTSNLKLNKQITTTTTTTTNRPPARLKHLTGPVLVSLFVNMPPMPSEAASTVADSISNALINSGYSGQTLRSLPSLAKHHHHHHYQDIKDDGDRSQASSNDRLFFESIGSFEDPFMNRTSNGLWHNVHHPQFSTIKVLHARKQDKSSFGANNSFSQIMNTSSLGNLSQASLISTNDRLYEKVEQLTKNYFPSIRQIRHGHPCPELITSRMHLHREEKRDFVPVLFRSRIGR